MIARQLVIQNLLTQETKICSRYRIYDTIILAFEFPSCYGCCTLVLLRKPVSPDTNFAMESANELFQTNSPPVDLVGSAKDGYEWVEHNH